MASENCLPGTLGRTQVFLGAGRGEPNPTFFIYSITVHPDFMKHLLLTSTGGGVKIRMTQFLPSQRSQAHKPVPSEGEKAQRGSVTEQRRNPSLRGEESRAGKFGQGIAMIINITNVVKRSIRVFSVCCKSSVYIYDSIEYACLPCKVDTVFIHRRG